ncbi:MAG: HEAT repeat domain-containing protein, partial [Planctomycetota bacterium]|nr:HEAT repeat domain-containing protein [Planctomycetota bacterium]
HGAQGEGERAVCPSCMSMIQGKDGGSSRSLGPWLFFTASLGFLSVLASFLVWKNFQTMASGYSQMQETFSKDVSLQLEASHSKLEKSLADYQNSRALLETQFERARTSLDNLRDDGQSRFSGFDASIEALASSVAELEDILSRLSRIEGTLSVVEDRQQAHRAIQENLRDELGRLSTQISRLEEAAPDTEESPFSSEVSALLRKLQDDDPEVRYAALEKLSAMQDPRLLPHIYPLLADPYEFTRFLAAHTFGDWDAKPSVPHLVEALLDEIAFVREAAVRSLRRLTGQSFNYDHDARESELQEGYRQWKAWWDSNGESFLLGE